jgi:hypothetical protein
MRIIRLIELIAVTLLVLAFVTTDIKRPAASEKLKAAILKSTKDSTSIIAIR